MPANKASHKLLSDKPRQKHLSGYWVGINGADPTTYKLPRGATLVRASEGVWTLTLPKNVAVVESAVFSVNDGGEVHEVSHTRSGRVFTVTHKTAASAPAPVVIRGSNLTDVAAADAATTNRSYAVATVAGTITKATAQLISGGPLNAAAVLTTNINGTPITGGAITLPDTSAAGVAVSVTPSAANTVAVGDVITAVTDAGGSTTTAAALSYVIQPTALAAEDVVDEIHFSIKVGLISGY